MSDTCIELLFRTRQGVLVTSQVMSDALTLEDLPVHPVVGPHGRHTHAHGFQHFDSLTSMRLAEGDVPVVGAYDNHGRIFVSVHATELPDVVRGILEAQARLGLKRPPPATHVVGLRRDFDGVEVVIWEIRRSVERIDAVSRRLAETVEKKRAALVALHRRICALARSAIEDQFGSEPVFIAQGWRANGVVVGATASFEKLLGGRAPLGATLDALFEWPPSSRSPSKYIASTAAGNGRARCVTEERAWPQMPRFFGDAQAHFVDVRGVVTDALVEYERLCVNLPTLGFDATLDFASRADGRGPLQVVPPAQAPSGAIMLTRYLGDGAIGELAGLTRAGRSAPNAQRIEPFIDALSESFYREQVHQGIDHCRAGLAALSHDRRFDALERSLERFRVWAGAAVVLVACRTPSPPSAWKVLAVGLRRPTREEGHARLLDFLSIVKDRIAGSDDNARATESGRIVSRASVCDPRYVVVIEYANRFDDHVGLPILEQVLRGCEEDGGLVVATLQNERAVRIDDEGGPTVTGATEATEAGDGPDDAALFRGEWAETPDEAPPPASPIVTGEILDGKYVVGTPLAGPRGRWLAHDRTTKQEVTLRAPTSWDRSADRLRLVEQLSGLDTVIPYRRLLCGNYVQTFPRGENLTQQVSGKSFCARPEFVATAVRFCRERIFLPLEERGLVLASFHPSHLVFVPGFGWVCTEPDRLAPLDGARTQGGADVADEPWVAPEVLARGGRWSSSIHRYYEGLLIYYLRTGESPYAADPPCTATATPEDLTRWTAYKLDASSARNATEKVLARVVTQPDPNDRLDIEEALTELEERRGRYEIGAQRSRWRRALDWVMPWAP